MLRRTDSGSAGRRGGGTGADRAESAPAHEGLQGLKIGSDVYTPDGPGKYLGFAFTTRDGVRVHMAMLEGGEFTTYEEA